MKFILSFLFLASLPASARAAPLEVSLIAGLPNGEMPFVQQILKEKVVMVPGENQADYTTALFYFASRNGTEAAQAIQIVDERGSATGLNLNLSIDKAAQNAAIVVVPVGGPGINSLCERAAGNVRTAYIMMAKALGNASPAGPCRAANILFVGALSNDLSDLQDSTHALLRLAVPAGPLEAPVAPGRSMAVRSLGTGMAMAAGKMAEILRQYPFLKGKALVDRFLNTRTERLSSLRGKVAGERALLRFER